MGKYISFTLVSFQVINRGSSWRTTPEHVRALWHQQHAELLQVAEQWRCCSDGGEVMQAVQIIKEIRSSAS